jgi:tetratricopeptide (TPR) repeat protein
VEQALEIIARLDLPQPEDAQNELLRQLDGHLEVIESQDAATPWRSFVRARVHVARGRSGEAIDQLQKFIQTREGRNEWRAYRMLGDLFVQEFPRLARGNYDRAAELKPDEPAVLFGLSLSSAGIGRRDDALRFAQQAVDADRRQTAQYLSHLARFLAGDGRWDEADHAAGSALELAQRQAAREPRSRRAMQALDAQYVLLIDLVRQRLAASERTSGAHPKLQPEQTAGLHLRWAEYARERGELAARLAAHDVVRILESGVERTEPSVPPALLERYAVALAEIDRADDALAAFERLLDIDPNNQAAPEWIERLKTNAASSP